MISDDELQTFTTACRDADQGALDRLAPRIGLAVHIGELRQLVKATRCKLVTPADVARLALATLDTPHGLAVHIVKKPRRPSSTHPLYWECGLAVRDDEHVVVGIRGMTRAPASVTKAWPQLGTWSTELARNRVRAEAWARLDDGDRRRIAIVARPKLVTTGARMTEAELVREMMAHPEDAGPRLVLADLLMQRGDVRGELFQLHHELATADLDDAARDACRARIQAIVADHGARLAGEIAEHVTSYTFAGGFVDTVTMSATAYRAHGARLFSLQPIRKLVVKPSSEKHLATVVAAPHLPELRALELGSSDSYPEFALAPLREARLARLEELSLIHCRLLDEAEDVLASLDAPNLRTLRLRGPWVLPPPVLRGLVANRRLGDSLQNVSISAPDARTRAPVAEAWRLPDLRRLELDDCWFEHPRWLADLVAHAPRLQEFVQVRSTDVSVITALLGCRELECLEVNATLDAKLLERILALPRLSILRFAGGAPDQHARLVERLLAVPPSHPLRRVWIEGYTFDPDGPLHRRFPWRPRERLV